MMFERLNAIIATGSVALFAVAAEATDAPQPIRVVFGMALVLILPGFATVCAVIPGREFSWGERMLASLGLSLGITICVSVVLAATPIGLSRGSASVALGVGTAAIASYAWMRTRQSV